MTPEDKAKAREDRARQMQAMRRGEDWALGVRDRGPAKRLTRDYVDSHRRPMEFYMYALILLIIALFAGRSSTALSSYMQYFLIVIIVIIAVDGLLLRRSVLKAVEQRLPGESTRGLGFYAIMRALQLRRFRTPAPRVKPGDDY
jgi:predicted lysophospholipase L1 biosynthesis ABC-type transport system permease subunit